MQHTVLNKDLPWTSRLWHGLTKLDFISNFFTWAMELLARITEPMASLSAIYIIICAGVPALLSSNLYTLALALIIGSPELLVVGAFKIASRELSQGNKKAWWLMLSCFTLLLLTALTVGDLFMWHWHQDAVNILMGSRCLAGIAYTFTRGITTDQGETVNVAPGSPVNLLLAEFTVHIQETVNQIREQTLAEVNRVNQSALLEVNRLVQGVNQQQQQLLAGVNRVNQDGQAELQAAIAVLAQQSQAALNEAIERIERANSRRLEAVYSRIEQVRVTLESNPVLPAVNQVGPGSPFRLPSRVHHQPTQKAASSEPVHASTVNSEGEPGDGSQDTKIGLGQTFAVNHYRRFQSMPTLAMIMANVACGKTLASKARSRAELDLGLKASDEE